jgi:hypothetical protein
MRVLGLHGRVRYPRRCIGSPNLVCRWVASDGLVRYVLPTKACMADPSMCVDRFRHVMTIWITLLKMGVSSSLRKRTEKIAARVGVRRGRGREIDLQETICGLRLGCP